MGLMAGLAFGDALGARYEGLHWAPPPELVRFGRGLLVWRRPGWWTDDTDMALGVIRAIRHLRTSGYRIDSEAGLECVLRQWLEWHRRANPLDLGVNTYRVLRRMQSMQVMSLDGALEISRNQLRHRARGGGNGAVMRTAPVALACLGDPLMAHFAGRRVSELTHPAERAMEAAGLWTLLCERAVSTGRIDVGSALSAVRFDSFWVRLLLRPKRPGRNGPIGWAPSTLADAWWCVRKALQDTPGPGALDRGVRLAVSSRVDPDTTAAVAGGLLGSVCGVAAVPLPAFRVVHAGAWTRRVWTLQEIAEFAGELIGEEALRPPL